MTTPTHETTKHKRALTQAVKIVCENDTGDELRDIVLLEPEDLYMWLNDFGFEWTGSEWSCEATA